jgi:zinc protease
MRGIAGDVGSNWQVARNLDFTRDMVEAIEAVTPAEVQAVANRYLVERGLTVTSLNPRDTLSAGRRTNGSAESGVIEKSALVNGVTLLTRRDPRVPLVTLHATLRGGSLAETRETAGLTRLMVRTLLKGTASRSAEAISGAIEELGGAISSDSGGSSWAVNVDVLQPDLELGLDVLADVLLNPTFPGSEVSREKDAQLAAIRADADRVTNVAFRHLREALFGPHPFSLERNGSSESIQRLTSADVAALHRRQAVAGNLVLAVFGDVDPVEVRRLVESRFAGMPAGPRGNTASGVGFAAGFSTVTHDVVHPKRQAVLAVGYPTVDLFHPDRAALDLLDESCSDMGSRLFLRIREELGLAYYTGAFQILGMAPGAFAFYLGTAPESLATAEHELVEQIRGLARHGLDPAEFERVKQSWLGKHLIHKQGPENLARMAALDELYGVGHDYHDRFAERIRSIPLDEVNAAAARYFGPDAPHATIRLHPAA